VSTGVPAVKQAAPVAKQAAPVAAKQVAPAKQATTKQAAATAVAAKAEAAPDSGDPFGDLFAAADAEYEMAPPPTPAPASKPPIARTAPVAAGAVAGGGEKPTSPMLAYGRGRGVAKAAPDDATKAAVVSDLYIPIALLIVGLVAYLFDAHLLGAQNAVEASIFVFIMCLLNVLLVFGALMVGVKVIGLGLGPIGPALLKIAAIAVLPAALGDLIRWYSGIGLVAWGATLLMYYALLNWLFDMDGTEIYIVTSIMWVVQFALGILIIGLLMTGIGFAAVSSRSGGAAMSGTFSGATQADDVTDDAKMSPSELDKHCENLITTNKAFESHEWLNPKFPNHQGLGYSQSEVRRLADDFVKAGAKKTWVAEIEDGEEGDVLCTRMLVEMPDDPKKRGGCLYVRDLFEGRDSKDTNGKYITVMIHVKHSGGGL
jgi:hypothetical protein